MDSSLTHSSICMGDEHHQADILGIRNNSKEYFITLGNIAHQINGVIFRFQIKDDMKAARVEGSKAYR